jgi:cell division protein FtsW
LFYLPEPHTDFIFAVIGEERGLMGTVLLVFYSTFGVATTKPGPDPFGRFCVGLMMMVVGQAFINMSGHELLPTKGSHHVYRAGGILADQLLGVTSC